MVQLYWLVTTFMFSTCQTFCMTPPLSEWTPKTCQNFCLFYYIKKCKMLKHSHNGCKLLLILMTIVIIIMSGYYEYVISLTISNNKYSSYLGLNFIANVNNNTDSELITGSTVIQNETKHSCPNIPSGTLILKYLLLYEL